MSDTTQQCPICGSASTQTAGVCVACALQDALEEFGPEETGEGLGCLGGLQLLEVIAQGGMGVVYKAHQTEPSRDVALKALPGAALISPEARERFRVEAQAMASLEHPGILPIYALGEDAGVPYFTMKLVTGGTLASRSAEYIGNFRKSAELVAGVAEAVHFAHERAVLHRDLKPGNILFDDAGQWHVSDFGLAKLTNQDSNLTRPEALMGTPNYMAPELFSEGASGFTTVSDVWSLGAILYELLAGHPPYQGDTMAKVVHKVHEGPPPLLPAQVPRDLRVIVGHALKHSPTHRYGSAKDLAEDLHRWLRGEPIRVRPAPYFERLLLWTKRKPAAAALIVLILAATAGTIFLLAKARRETLQRLSISLQAQARAQITSSEPGSRAAALEALRQAASTGVTSKELRETFISALALNDYAELRRIPWSNDTAPALSPNFDFAAFAKDGTSYLESASGPRMPLPSPTNFTSDVGPFSMDGSLLSIHADLQTYQLHVSSGKWLSLPGGKSLPRCPYECYSPDGKWLARCLFPSRPSMLQVFSLTDPNAPAWAWPVPWSKTRVFGFNADSTQVAVGGVGSTEVLVLETQTGREVRRLIHPASAKVRSGAWRPDGRALAIGTENFKIYLWHLQDHVMPPQLLGHAGNVQALAWSPDGSKLISAAMDGTTRLWDATSGAVLVTWPWTGTNVACAADGSQLATTDAAKKVTIVSQLRSHGICAEIPVPHPDLDVLGTVGSWCAAFSPDGRFVCAGDSLGIFLYDSTTGKSAGHFPADYCWSIVFPDANTLCGGTRKGIYRWRLPPAAAPSKEEKIDPVDCNMLATFPGQQTLLATADHLLLEISPDGTSRTTASESPLDGLATHPAGRYVAASYQKQGGISIWDREQMSQPPVQVKSAGDGASLAWTPDGSLLLVGDEQGLRALSTGTFQEIWSLPSKQSRIGPTRVAVANSHLCAASLEKGVLTLADPADGRILVRLVHPNLRDVRSLSFSPDGQRLVAMTLGHVLQLWNLQELHTQLAAEGLDWQ